MEHSKRFHKIFREIWSCRLRPCSKNSSWELQKNMRVNIDDMVKTIALFGLFSVSWKIYSFLKNQAISIRTPSTSEPVNSYLDRRSQARSYSKIWVYILGYIKIIINFWPFWNISIPKEEENHSFSIEKCSSSRELSIELLMKKVKLVVLEN